MNTNRPTAQERSTGPSAPDFSTLLPTPLALDEVTLASYAVLHNRLELHLKSPRLQIDIAELLTHLAKISAGKYVVRCTLESIWLPLCLLSVASTKTATLLRCQTLKNPTMAAELLPMVGRARLSLTIGDGLRPRGSCGYDKAGAITTERRASGQTLPSTADAFSPQGAAAMPQDENAGARLLTNADLIRYDLPL